MGQDITLKKFKLRHIVISACFWASAQAIAEPQHSQNQLPYLRNAGIIPLQTSGNNIPKDLVQHINTDFYAAVAASNRFFIIDNDLVKGLWSTPKGRAELARDYELHTFVGAELKQQADTLTLFVRLLDPSLQTYIIESTTEQVSTWAKETPKQLGERVHNAVYRVINRLPVDAYVTSVQDKFFTLSGGSNQGIELQDQIEIRNSSITSTHPANGSWLSFKNEVAGSGVIIDVQSATAIAQIIHQTHEGAIHVGAGSHIPALKSRAVYRPQIEAPRPTEAKLVPLTPLYSANGEKVQPHSPDHKPLKTETTAQDPAPAQISASPSGETSPPPAETASSSSTPFYSFSFMKNLLSKIGQNIALTTGFISSSYSGPATANSSISVFNCFNMQLRHQISNDMLLLTKGGLKFGSTTNGSYGGFDARSGVRKTFPFLNASNNWHLSAGAGFKGIGIFQETFGGGDVFSVIFGGGISNHLRIQNTQLHSEAEFRVLPALIGQFGIKESPVSVTSGMITEIELSSFAVIPKFSRSLQFGGGMVFENGSYTLGSDILQASVSQYTFGVKRKL
jgi:hypothetical protein